MKTKILITAMGLGLSLNAFAFFNEPANTGSDAKAPVEQTMTAPVDQEMKAPVKQEMSSPADKVVVDQAELARQIEQEAERKRQEQAERERRAQMDQAELARQIEEEARREKREAEEKARAEERARAEAERQAAQEKARARQEAARNKQQKIVSLRREAQQFIPELDLVQMPDRIRFKNHQAEIKALGGSDNKDVIRVLELGAQKYLIDGQRQLNSVINRLEHASVNKNPGQYKAAVADMPEALELAQTMLNLSRKYRDGFRLQNEFQDAIDSWEAELPGMQSDADSLAQGGSGVVNTPIGAVDVNRAADGAVGATKEIGGATVDLGKKGFGKLKGLFGG